MPPIVCFEGESLSEEEVNVSWEGLKVTTQKNGYFTQATFLPVIKHFE